MAASKRQQLATAKRRGQAVELRLAGLSFQQIADQLGYAGKAAAAVDLNHAFEQMVMERSRNMDLLIEEQVAVLTRMRRAVWPAAIQGDTRAVDSVAKITDRICKLQRLYPENSTTVNVFAADAIDRQIQQLTQQIQLEGSQYEWSDAGDELGAVQALPPGGVEETPA